MIAATLFSGIGAPEVAMPHWRWAWHAEIEKFPSAVMAARHPCSINLGDVSAHDFADWAAEIGRPDVLVFGSPCQSFSVAGKRLGLDDPRGNLALVALGIVDRLKPDWFVFENVPGLFSSFSGSEHAAREVHEGSIGGEADGEESRDLATFLALVHERRYSGAWASLDAQWFGVAQRRLRLFFVGHTRDWRGPAAVLLEPESLRGDHPPRRQAGQRPAPTFASRPTGGGGLGTDFDCDGGLIASHEVAQPLLAKANSSHRADAESYIARALTAFSSKDYGADLSVEIAPTMRAMGHSGSHANAGGQLAVAVALRGREGGATAELSDVPSALRAGGGGGDKAHVLTSQVRRLTPRECERLQGFPDDYTLITYRGKPAADGPRYKALGNSMAVPVIRWILDRIEKVSALTTPPSYPVRDAERNRGQQPPGTSAPATGAIIKQP
jgi:DNA (cytosine-5)-methyltransferase 1